MTDLTVIGSSRNRGFRVIWMLEELGLPYAIQPDPPRSDAVRSASPLGKVPILVEDGTALTDSVAILTYLADRHSSLTFPAGTQERARQDGLMQFVVEEMDSLLWAAAKHSFILPENLRTRTAKDAAIWEYQRTQRRFETLLGDGPFLMGDTMTIADIIACHCIGWAVIAKFPPPTDIMRSYSQRLRDRPAYQRARQAE